MGTQSEATLETNLIEQLAKLEYQKVTIKDDKALEANLKTQLEIHNNTHLSDKEFKRVLNHLNKGSVFEKAKLLRDKFSLSRDDGTTQYIEFLNSEHWCQNEFQVTSQVSVEGVYKNRYDVTLLINGLPLVQIELKRRGLELKEAFNQINRYQRHSYGSNSALFNYVQLFVISNGVNTKYYANNKTQSFKQTFYWADEENQNITNLGNFTDVFLERCHVAKMICKYIVLAEVPKILMVLRPYQFHAVEAIIERVNNSDKNGYIWHTTGSGKTLTSFKASQILMKLPKVHKVVFVVDRKDLDFQTTKEFNSFSDGSVDGTDNTKALVRQFGDDTKLIVTTIQKLNTAISKTRYLEAMEEVRDEHIVFIFDECHRSQFGETHLAITNFFTNNQMIGFTGTPIFKENAVGNKLGKRTTRELFDDVLHKYVITDAIADENVLKFSVEYVGRYKERGESATNIDIEVEDIDTKELLESEVRAEKIVDYIIANHSRKTHNREFTAMMCVSSVDMLIKYYEIFKAKEHKFKIATIFSYTANEEDKDADGVIELDGEAKEVTPHTREKLDEYIGDYNAMFGTKYSTKDSQSFYNYYNELSKRVKNREIDILLVVNMFLTGFDAKSLNTLYVDKNLKYHGLIQAFSRTNRILNEQKSQGNIVCFRNLKPNTDDAIALFSNKDAKDIILMKPYEEYVREFNEAYQEKLLAIAPTVDSVNTLVDEEAQFTFVQAFRALMRLKNILAGFSDFSFESLEMSAQEFEDYKSKYLDLYESIKSNKEREKVSILEDVDFELELIQVDEINVNYILMLLAKLKDAKEEDKKAQKEHISNIINGDASLRSKRELIEKFINENLMGIEESEDVVEEFEKFWEVEREKGFNALCREENLKVEEVEKVIGNYIYDERIPLKKEIEKTLLVRPKLLERRKIIPRVTDKILDYVEKFMDVGVVNNSDYEEEVLMVAEPREGYEKS
jgi:type I restriction enzyme R subunit